MSVTLCPSATVTEIIVLALKISEYLEPIMIKVEVIAMEISKLFLGNDPSN